jgi:modulator of FtsH protease
VTAYDASRWSEFALSQLGASAALLGLLFVGISINLRDVVGSSQLVHRAGESVVMLAGVLAAATAVLIPDQDRGVLAAELIAVGAVTLVVTSYLQRGASSDVVPRGDRGPTRGTVIVRRLLGLGSAGLVAVAGITLAAGSGGGLFWWPAAVFVAYVGALLNTWVLMVEILR